MLSRLQRDAKTRKTAAELTSLIINEIPDVVFWFTSFLHSQHIYRLSALRRYHPPPYHLTGNSEPLWHQDPLPSSTTSRLNSEKPNRPSVHISVTQMTPSPERQEASHYDLERRRTTRMVVMTTHGAPRLPCLASFSLWRRAGTTNQERQTRELDGDVSASHELIFGNEERM
ncbi:hypothetical protein BDZ97DRAFT_2080035 [Flammula alnicola]|nr:hypothetical protein BDZ97DRAFT_2080035 [Flammula alnicola]